MTSPPEISVVIPSHHAGETIEACLDGLERQTLSRDRFEVHVIDSGEDGTGWLVAARTDPWQGRLIYHLVPGGGPGRRRNLGVERAASPFLAFIDSDCVPEPGWLEAGLAHLHRGAAIVQGPTLTPDSTPPPAFSHAIFREGPSPLFESCNIMYEAEMVRTAGGFPEDLFDSTGNYMGEDTELAWSVRRLGGKSVFEPSAVVRHMVHPPDFRWHLRYQWQLRFFPRLVARVPELRREALTGGVFLGPRSLRGSGAVAAVVLGRRNRAAYALALPYLASLARAGRGAPTPRAAAGAVARRLLSDAVRQVALGWGSLRYRSPVL